MQGIYTHIPEKNYVPREYGFAAILLFLFMVLISLVSVLNLLYFYISTFRNMCAVPNMTVFCSSLTSWFPGMLLTYFLNYFEIVPVATITTGITFVFTFHMRCISIIILLLLLLLKILLRRHSVSLLIFLYIFFPYPSQSQSTFYNIKSTHVPLFLCYSFLLTAACRQAYFYRSFLPPWESQNGRGLCQKRHDFVIWKKPDHLVSRNKFLQETPGQISLKLTKPGLSRGEKTEIIVSLSTENGLIMAELPKQMPVSELQDGVGS